MTAHTTATREQWLAARLELLEAEKHLTRLSDDVAEQRRRLPWVAVDKQYRFETEAGTASLADLFDGCSQLLVYHFMFGPQYTGGCPSCSAIADGFNGSVVHLSNHDVKLIAVSRAPLDQLLAYRRRMGWSFGWASAHDTEFNYDFNVSCTEDQQRSGSIDYNFRTMDTSWLWTGDAAGVPIQHAAMTGTDTATYMRELPGMSAFVLEDGVVYHTYSAYARGVDGIWGMYQWLDRAPKGRNEDGAWWRRHDEY